MLQTEMAIADERQTGKLAENQPRPILENFIYNKVIHKVMETLAKTRKIGGSLVITLPKTVVEAEDLTIGQTVKIDVKKIKKSGFGLCKGLGHFSKESKFKGQLEKNE